MSKTVNSLEKEKQPKLKILPTVSLISSRYLQRLNQVWFILLEQVRTSGIYLIFYFLPNRFRTLNFGNKSLFEFFVVLGIFQNKSDFYLLQTAE